MHGAGAAKYAHDHRGAQYGVGVGRTGQCYAIPTKDYNIQSLKLEEVKVFVDEFIQFAMNNPQYEFQVTCIGCGLAMLANSDIAPMFKNAPDNCWFDTNWKPWLGEVKYWGTY